MKKRNPKKKTKLCYYKYIGDASLTWKNLHSFFLTYLVLFPPETTEKYLLIQNGMKIFPSNIPFEPVLYSFERRKKN